MNMEMKIKMDRPTITNGKTGIGNFGVGVMPDGTEETLRILIKPDGFHFMPSDFDDLALPSISFESTNGDKNKLSFGNAGELLINDKPLMTTDNLLIGGRNLILNSDKDFILTSKDRPYRYERIYTELLPGTTYTFSSEIESIGSTATGLVYAAVYDRNLKKFYYGKNLKADKTRQSFTFTVPNNVTDNATLIVYSGEKEKTANLKGVYHFIKLETGNVMTGWTPAPEDKADNNSVIHNYGDETIGDNKTYTGLTKLNGGLQLLSNNGKSYDIIIDDEGNLKTSEVKE